MAKAPSVKAAPSKAAEKSVDCSDASLSQADWVKHCGEMGAGGDGGPSTGLAFGETYAWPDGVEATVVDARLFSDWDGHEEPDPKSTEFRIRLKVSNKGRESLDLSDFTLMVDGATNGGQASSSTFSKGSAPLEGRLAPGLSAVKTDDNALEKQYGRVIVVTVQRVKDDEVLTFPEFAGKVE